MNVTAFGKRYYEDELGFKVFERLTTTIEKLNHDKIMSYDALYFHQYPQKGRKDLLDPAKGDHMIYHYLRGLGYNSLYANNMEPVILGILKSQETLHKNNIEEQKEKNDERRQKACKLHDSLKKKQAVKEALVTYFKTGDFHKPYPHCTIKIDTWGLLSGRKIPKQYPEVYERKVEEQIRRLKHRIKMIQASIRRHEDVIRNMENNPPKRAIFGSRRLYRQKDTAGLTEAWRKEFHEARTKSFVFSGRADSKHGNYVMKWDEKTRDLIWTLPEGKDPIVFRDYLPMNYREEYIAALRDGNASRTSMAYSLEIRRDGNNRRYVLIKASFKLPEDPHVNFSTSDGCIAYDTNVDHFAWAGLKADGSLIETGVIPFNLTGKTSGQAKEEIGKAVKLLVGLAEARKKPLAREDLNAPAMRRGMLYQSKKRNRKISQFACEKLIGNVESKAKRSHVAVFTVKPKYTSFMGKVLYMRKYGLSVHCAAAVSIGNIFLNGVPDIPNRYEPFAQGKIPKRALGDPEKTKYVRWGKLYTRLKTVRTHAFFLDIPGFDKKKELNAWLKEYDKVFTHL